VNQIKSIRIKNFESHEDSILDDFSPGLNAIIGLSNAGKSSVIRALALVCYNEFDPQSVRHGHENCEVEVTTSNGKVKVTRGKKNLWEVTDRTGKTSYFDKIGKQILPEVSEILGFGLVKLGDVEMKVNIMDQLESHFMLAGFGDKEATGSLRAQVVDEISGLSGIETLIREVSLDNSRLTREANQIEDKNSEISGQMHDPVSLKTEDDLLVKVAEKTKQIEDDQQAVELIRETVSFHKQASDNVNALQSTMDSLPDAEKSLNKLRESEENGKRAQSATRMHGESETIRTSMQAAKDGLSVLSDDVRVKSILGGMDGDLEKTKGMMTLQGQAQKVSETLASAVVILKSLPAEELVKHQLSLAESADKTRAEMHKFVELFKLSLENGEKTTQVLSVLPNDVKVSSVLAQVEKTKGDLQKKQAFLETCEKASKEAKRSEEEAKRVQDECETATNEYNEVLKTIDVGPVTMKPMSKACLKEIGQ
jgi:exonuclease SbcC